MRAPAGISRYYPSVHSLGLLALRLGLALVFVMHGAHATFGIAAGPGVGPGGLSATGAAFSKVGIEPGLLMGLMAAVIQLTGGLLIGAGYLTRYAAAAVLGYVMLAGWKMHLMWGFFLNWGGDPTRGHGLEYSIALGGGLLCLVLTGPGDWSIDGRRATRASERAAGRARLRRS
jgi:putative oxidoreductase